MFGNCCLNSQIFVVLMFVLVLTTLPPPPKARSLGYRAAHVYIYRACANALLKSEIFTELHGTVTHDIFCSLLLSFILLLIKI